MRFGSSVREEREEDMSCNASEKHMGKTPFVTKLRDVKQFKSALNETAPTLTHHYLWLGQKLKQSQLLYLLPVALVPGEVFYPGGIENLMSPANSALKPPPHLLL